MEGDDRYATRDELRALWLEVARIKDRELAMSQTLEGMRHEFQDVVRRMHADNLQRFDHIRDDTGELKNSFRVLNASVDALLLSKARLEGGTSVARGVWALLRSPFGKLWVWLVGLGWLFTQVTADKLDMLRIWLFGK